MNDKIFPFFRLLSLIAVVLFVTTINAQQWQGLNNSDSVLSRAGGITIGLNTPVYGKNNVHVAKHFVVRTHSNGDLSDFVNEQSNLEHGSDVIWAVLCGPQPNNPGLFHLTSQEGQYGSIQHERFIVRYNGNVGIGLRDPQYKLDVAGVIHTMEVIVDQDNWPDYVFKKNYKPISLKELEAFIRKNKHLPEIPTADDIRTKGVKIGDITNKLVKKIEEMTLYIINQNKALEEIRAENKTLKNHLKRLELKLNRLAK